MFVYHRFRWSKKSWICEIYINTLLTLNWSDNRLPLSADKWTWDQQSVGRPRSSMGSSAHEMSRLTGPGPQWAVLPGIIIIIISINNNLKPYWSKRFLAEFLQSMKMSASLKLWRICLDANLHFSFRSNQQRMCLFCLSSKRTPKLSANSRLALRRQRLNC